MTKGYGLRQRNDGEARREKEGDEASPPPLGKGAVGKKDRGKPMQLNASQLSKRRGKTHEVERAAREVRFD